MQDSRALLTKLNSSHIEQRVFSSRRKPITAKISRKRNQHWDQMSEQDSDASDRKKMRSDHKTEMDLLTEQRKQLEDDNKRLQREIQRLQAKNFEADQDLELAAKESLEVVKLRDMLMAKEREIIYLGEQCLNAKEKLEAFHKNYFLVVRSLRRVN